MKKIKSLICLLLVFVTALLGACSNKKSGGGADAITLNMSSINIDVGAVFVLRANFGDVIWQSDDETVASVDSQGRVQGLSAGSTNIVAAKGNRTAQCTVNVKQVEQQVTYSVGVSQTQAILAVGESMNWTVAVLRNGETISEAPSFSSSDEAIVTVSAGGALKAISPGQATVTAAYGDARAALKVTVGKNDNVLVLSETSAKLKIGEVLTLQAQLYKAGQPTNEKVTFSACNNNVSVSESGVVVGIFTGDVIVTAKCEDLTAHCKVRVYKEEEIATVDDFVSIKDDPYIEYKLVKDVDFSDYVWNKSTIVPRLSSVFDGNGHKLYNLQKNVAGSYTAVFGELSETATVKNTAFYVDRYLFGSDCGIIVHNNRGLIENCYMKLSATATDTAFATILCSGTVNENYGTMRNLLVDIVVLRGSSPTTRVHALAAKNFGNIDDCVVISAATHTFTATDEEGNEITKISYHLLSGSGDVSAPAGYGYSGTGASATDNSFDVRRGKCLIFVSAEALLTFGSGSFAIDGNKGAVDQEKVGEIQLTQSDIFGRFPSSIWTFSNDSVSFYGSELYAA